jgi:hypothetical protein
MMGYLSDACINHTDWYVWYGLTGTLRRGTARIHYWAKTVSCRDGDLTSGHRMPRAGQVSRHHGVHVMLPKSKAKSVGPPVGEVPPSDPESRERLEILPIGAGDRVFRSAFDSKAT